MKLNSHSSVTKILAGTHAFLAPSSPAWVNYDDDKLARVYYQSVKAKRGTDLHELAQRAITLGVKLSDTKTTISLYVNDAIGFKLSPEVLLFYSENCYGHADALGFKNNTLRIHDLKTGSGQAPFTQLEIYAALFCLEYKMKPFDIQIELRIYQNDNIKEHFPDADVIFHIMDRIISFDKFLNNLRLED